MARPSFGYYKMTDFSKSFDYNEVPDPYYGGSAGFELVLDLLEDAGEEFFKFVEITSKLLFSRQSKSIMINSTGEIIRHTS